MVESMHETCKLGVAAYAQTAREKWVLEWPGQVVLVVTGIFWTLDVTNALTQGVAGKYMLDFLTCGAAVLTGSRVALPVCDH